MALYDVVRETDIERERDASACIPRHQASTLPPVRERHWDASACIVGSSRRSP